MQNLTRNRPVQIVLNLSDDIETMLNTFKDKESFILQAITNELSRVSEQNRVEEGDFTPEQLASIENGLADVKAGRTISHEEMTQKLSHLRTKLNTAIAQKNGN